MKLSLSFAWFDLWIGAYWDSHKHTLYICPLPCIVLKLAFRPQTTYTPEDIERYIDHRTNELLQIYQDACNRHDIYSAARAIEASNEINRIIPIITSHQ